MRQASTSLDFFDREVVVTDPSTSGLHPLDKYAITSFGISVFGAIASFTERGPRTLPDIAIASALTGLVLTELATHEVHTRRDPREYSTTIGEALLSGAAELAAGAINALSSLRNPSA